MKAKYFTAGLAAAVLILAATGAETRWAQGPQWEYAELTRQLYLIRWATPDEEYPIIAEADEATREARYAVEVIFKQKMGIIDRDGELTSLDILNRVGEEGWELVYEKSDDRIGQVRYLFKRPVP